jgi:ribosome-binding ATPase YchF (GTP1/OBG family)
MPFEKGDKRINRSGRKKGAKNKVSPELKQSIEAFLNKNWKDLEKQYKALSSRDKMKFYTDLLPYVVPKLQNSKNEFDLTNLTQSQLEMIADNLINNLTDEN